MKSSIIAKLEALQERRKKVEALLSDPNIISDQVRFRVLSKEYAQFLDVTSCFGRWKKVKENINIAERLLNDPEMHDIAHEELQEAILNKKKLEQQLQILLLPKDPDDERGCFIEIRAGTGGDEAALFVGELFRMYSRFAENRKWNIDIVSISDADHGGYKEIIAKISNKGAYGILKFESGGHRVQRIPETESQGRIHTSVCTVVVMPEVPEKELPKINDVDLRIDTFRSSGAGGQHVNTTESAIRITHIPTGLVVECQDERSQHKNKAKALAVLGARLRAIEVNRRQQDKSSTRRKLLGCGDRYDRIRTYNFSQRRVTDHRIYLTLYRLEEIIGGKLDILIQPIMQEYQADQLIALSEQ
ncbi:Peptide chain release factor 1 [secondary endosymbiont of Trabutina mannipara]|uniref:Peptide chain release factor 1 n=1 Tax=secondary endosymbiont of Trabutina mannipara TaxID=1835721 RepID=A0A1C3L3U1_9ENTR|nr:peptide chain release factor 1 [secondary endosymbiont of Trabutina mannipara]SBT81941.1 Peptide chain release factor 1 [secondary endosymbiont of Trabutina mannipara]